MLQTRYECAYAAFLRDRKGHSGDEGLVKTKAGGGISGECGGCGRKSGKQDREGGAQSAVLISVV
jgi:hypothetical protein